MGSIFESGSDEQHMDMFRSDACHCPIMMTTVNGNGGLGSANCEGCGRRVGQT